MANIEQAICDAIDIIVNKAVSEAAYDKTVRATILNCENESTGYYKLRYQDSVIYAYSLQTDYTYVAGTSVYVLVPADDMTNTKTILGTTEKLGNDYVTVIEPEDQFSVVGTNVIVCNNTYALQSYRQNGCSINLYNKNNTNNAIYINTTAVEQYFMDSDVLICGGVIQTVLAREQQTQGDYGILFTLEFRDQSTGGIIERQYPVNIDIMTGQPYNYVNPTRQYGIFEFDKENFIDIEDITIYCKDFPYWNNNPEDDIFISAIEMSGAVAVSQEDLNGYYLNLTTAKGTYFAADVLDVETLTAEAVLRDAGKIVNIDSQDLPVYWFVEHAGITPKSQYYCSFGGSGWKCLNEYLLISDETENAEAVVEWIPGDKTFTLAKADLKARSAQYKCVVIYNSTAVSATVTFKNLGSKYDIAIESTNGTKFYFDVGSTSLITTVNDEEARGSEYSYAWAISDAFGNYTTLTNDDVTSALEVEYEEKYQEILNNDDLYEEQKEVMIEELNAEYKELLSGTYVDGNRVENIKASSIYIFNTYKCSVFEYDDFIGTVSITLLNSDEATGYNLVMNNNSYTYKYDESGVAPTSSSNLSPVVLLPLTYTLYDCNGQDITEDVFNVCTVKWYVPSSDVSLLTISDSYDNYIIGEEQGYIVYEGIKDLVYEIALKYNIAKITNDIYLTVTYQNILLAAKSNLTFVKEGENGTNGTEYSCKIVPNIKNNETVPVNVVVSQIGTNSYSYNYTVTQNQPLSLQLYHNEELVYNSPSSGGVTLDEGLAVNLTWKILQNIYNFRVSDSSNITITDSANGVMIWDPSIESENAANIIQVQVVIGDSKTGTTLYATLPILSVRYSNQSIANTYTLKLKDNTGFLYVTYASDGSSPQWSNLTPFDFDITKEVNNITCSVRDEVTNQTKKIVGQTYDTSKSVWSDSNNLLEYNSALHEVEGDYQWWLKPCDIYDGWCTTNAVMYSCSIDGGTAEIHIPVHFMMNRYGLASLNGWDGNTIQIDSDGGFILAPQIGAGHKEDDNSFTGMVMGDVRESGNSSYNVAVGLETGLFAYNKGRRTIFLDAETGKSEFGIAGSGQIILDPTSGESGEALIYGGNYVEGVSGLVINLTTGAIEYGNGNFKLDENGLLIAVGYSTTDEIESAISSAIEINNNQVIATTYTKNGEVRSQFAMEGDNITITSGIITFNSGTLVINSDNFSLTSNGDATFGGTLSAPSGIIGGWNIGDSLYDGCTSMTSTHSGTYIGTDGIRQYASSSAYVNIQNGVITAFGADISGSITATTLTCTNGTIGGWEIGEKSLYNGCTSIDSTSRGTYIGTDGIRQYASSSAYVNIQNGVITAFGADISGSITATTLTCTNGSLAGWTIDEYSIYTGTKNSVSSKDTANVQLSAGTFSRDLSDWGHISGLRFAIGDKFAVASDGTLYAENAQIQGNLISELATIGGWTLDDYSLYTGNRVTYTNSEVDKDSDVTLSSALFTKTINNTSIENLRIAIGSNFGITSDGDVYAGTLYVGQGSKKIIIEKMGTSSTSEASIHYSKTSCEIDTRNGFYFGTEGLAISKYFLINESTAIIAGWTASESSLYNNTDSLNSAVEGIYLGIDGVRINGNLLIINSENFQLDQHGQVTCNFGTFGEYIINGNYIYNGTKTVDDSTPGVYIGTDGIKLTNGADPYIGKTYGESYFKFNFNDFIIYQDYSTLLDDNSKYTLAFNSGALFITQESTQIATGIGYNYIELDKYLLQEDFINGDAVGLYMDGNFTISSLIIGSVYYDGWGTYVLNVTGDSIIRGDLKVDQNSTHSARVFVENENGKMSLSAAGSGTNNAGSLGLYNWSAGENGGWYCRYFPGDSSNEQANRFGNARSTENGGLPTEIYGTGVYLNGSSTAVTSDRILKDDITTLTTKYDNLIEKLTPRAYTLKAGGEEKHIGFIADEVETAMQDAGLNPEDYGIVDHFLHDGEMLGAIRYDEIIPILVYEIQSLRKRINVLEG